MTTERRRSAGQIWGTIRVQLHVDVLEWMDSFASHTDCLKHVLNGAFDTYIICHRAPEEDLPPRALRKRLDTTVPIGIAEILEWWASVKGIMRTKLLRGLLTEAYYAALEAGWRAPAPEDTAA